MDEKKKIRLGLLIPKAKKRKIQLPERIQERCDKEGIEITDLEMDSSLENVGPFDVFLHKAIDFYSENYENESIVLEKIQKVKDFLKKFPDMSVIDDIEICEKLLVRKFQVSVLQQCAMNVNGIEVFTPKSLEIKAGTTIEEASDAIAREGVKFPILAKPVWATQKEGSHTMTMIFNVDHLKDLPIPCIIQEFCNHGGVVYKVFVIGDRFNICERPSVRNVDCTSRESLVFDTRNVSKTEKPFIPDVHGVDPHSRQWISCDENPNLLDRKCMDELRKKVTSITGLTFYGMDILVDEKTGKYAFIDLNQFPGFRGISNEHFVENLVHFIKQCANK